MSSETDKTDAAFMLERFAEADDLSQEERDGLRYAAGEITRLRAEIAERDSRPAPITYVCGSCGEAVVEVTASCHNSQCDHFSLEISAEARAVPDGWVMVRREPTPAMIKYVDDNVDLHEDNGGIAGWSYKACWRAMICAHESSEYKPPATELTDKEVAVRFYTENPSAALQDLRGRLAAAPKPTSTGAPHDDD